MKGEEFYSSLLYLKELSTLQNLCQSFVYVFNATSEFDFNVKTIFRFVDVTRKLFLLFVFTHALDSEPSNKICSKVAIRLLKK